ncbi:MAG: hypothetical protein LW689_04375 [Novosphingobium sp.]|jgi:hypothetical protein|nr:hypothetical protein [Novosphingobium sp.]MCE2842020.1 hypothetical protein [Novosphingobium sp.]
MPAFRAIATRSAVASAATISPAKPAVDGAGGLLLAIVTTGSTATHNCGTAGWTKYQQVNTAASFAGSIWYAAEDAAAPTFTWTGATTCSAQVVYYSDPQSPMTIGIGANTFDHSVSGSTHSTLSIMSTQNNALAVYVDVCQLNVSATTPSGGWTERSDTGSATDGARTVLGDLLLPTVVGSFTGGQSLIAGDAPWIQWTIELNGTSPVNQVQVSKAELGAVVEPAAGFAASQAELGAWLDLLRDTPRRQFITIN